MRQMHAVYPEITLTNDNTSVEQQSFAKTVMTSHFIFTTPKNTTCRITFVEPNYLFPCFTVILACWEEQASQKNANS